MLLADKDAAMLRKVYWSLITFVFNNTLGKNKKLELEFFLENAPNEIKLHARDNLLENLDLIDQYLKINPEQFDAKDLLPLQEWRKIKKEKYIIERNLKKHTIFLDCKSTNRAYGVLGLYTEIEDMLPFIPCMVDAVLLPWKGEIAADGLLNVYNISYGPGIRSTFKEQYQDAKKHGIIASF